MRRISTLLEVLLSAVLFVFGLYLVRLAISTESAYGTVVLIAGAVSFSLGQMTLVFAVKSILWHRRMLRRSVRKQNADTEFWRASAGRHSASRSMQPRHATSQAASNLAITSPAQ